MWVTELEYLFMIVVQCNEYDEFADHTGAMNFAVLLNVNELAGL